MSEPPSRSRPVLLVIGDAVAATGFSRVVRSILEPMVPDWEIHQLAINYHGDPHSWPWDLYPAAAGSGDPFGVGRAPELFDCLSPDLVFAVGTLNRLQAYVTALGERAGRVPIVGYCALESGPLAPELVPDCEQVNSLVFYTEYARSQFVEASARANSEAPQRNAREVLVIPHGVDTAQFFPLEPDDPDRDAVKRRAKERLFRGDEEHANSFVVLNANRNEPRKRIDLTVRGFAEFARSKDAHVKLHLHMGTRDAGWDIIELCRRFGIYDRLIMTNENPGLPEVPIEELNLIYNAADVGINTSSAEGWGLVSFEHASTRTAQVVPRHASCADLWTGSAEMIDPGFVLTDPSSMSDQHLVTPAAIADALERLYTDANHRREIADRCFENATQPEYSWSTISGRWHDLLRHHLEAPTGS